MEAKLRVIAEDANVVAFYDVCRSKLSDFPSLTRGGEEENESGMD